MKICKHISVIYDQLLHAPQIDYLICRSINYTSIPGIETQLHFSPKYRSTT